MVVENILELITCEIERLSDEVDEYRKEMDRSETFGSKYWMWHDRYQATFIKHTYLTGLLDKIRRLQ